MFLQQTLCSAGEISTLYSNNAQPPGESSLSGVEGEAPTDCQTLDLGGAVWLLLQWNNEPVTCTLVKLLRRSQEPESLVHVFCRTGDSLQVPHCVMLFIYLHYVLKNAKEDLIVHNTHLY